VGRSDRGGQPPAKRPAQGLQEGADVAAGAGTMAGNGGPTRAAPAAVPIKTPFPRAPQGTARNGAADGVAVTKATDPSAFSFGLQAAKAQLASRPTTMAPTEHRASESAGRPKVSLKALSSYKAARASAEEDAKGRTQKVRLRHCSAVCSPPARGATQASSLLAEDREGCLCACAGGVACLCARDTDKVQKCVILFVLLLPLRC